MIVLRAVTLLAALLGASPAFAAVGGGGSPIECEVAEVQAQTCGERVNGFPILIIDGADGTECGNPGDTGGGAVEVECRWSDVLLGQRTGGYGILVLTGVGQTHRKNRDVRPDFTAKNFAEAADWIIKKG